MRGYLTALLLAQAGLVAGSPALAQDAQPEAAAASPEAGSLTAEEIIEVARERLRPPGVRRACKLPENSNEIVVCAPDADEYRVESPTDEAQRTGTPGRDTIPRSPNVDGPGIFQGKGMKMGKDPVPALIVDLTDEPTPLSAEDAARVYRVEDGPPRAAPPQPDSETKP